MNATVCLLFAGLLLALAFWVGSTWRQFCDALRRVADGEPNAAFHAPRSFWVRGAAGDLCRLAESINESRRRLADETVDLQSILGSLTEGVVVIDAAQRIRLANASVHRLFNLREPAVGRTLMEVFRDHGLWDTALAALNQGTPQSRQLTLDVQRDGRYSPRHFAVTAVRLDHSAGAIAIFHDITQLNALAAARRDFVANVSHELRTPLAIINGYLETLLDGALDDGPTARRFLETMARHGERLKLLIEDLLSLSDLESRPGGGLSFAAVDLRACLERATEQLRPLIAEKHVAVVLDVPAGSPWIEADARRLDQVFINLLENALKYGDAAEPCIRVSAQFDAQAVEVRVADNGPGIPRDDLPHLFERFYRVHKDRSRAVGGTGLGLAIVKHVVLAHGGEVTVESAPGRGASFRVRLPLAQSAAN